MNMVVMPILCSSCPLLDEAPSEAKEVKKNLPEKQSTLPVSPQCSKVVLGERPVSPSVENMTESLRKTHSSRECHPVVSQSPLALQLGPLGSCLKAQSNYPTSRTLDTQPDLCG